jgi:hypothetical protein
LIACFVLCINAQFADQPIHQLLAPAARLPLALAHTFFLLLCVPPQLENRRSLAEMLQREEEKRRPPVVAAANPGPMILYRSRRGEADSVSFSLPDAYPPFFSAPDHPPMRTDPAHAVCSVTSQPARYRESSTLLPFSTAQAFAAIRELHNVAKAHPTVYCGATAASAVALAAAAAANATSHTPVASATAEVAAAAAAAALIIEHGRFTPALPPFASG